MPGFDFRGKGYSPGGLDHPSFGMKPHRAPFPGTSTRAGGRTGGNKNALVTIKGQKELIAKLSALSGVVKGDQVLNVLMRGARLMRNAAIARAPMKTGLLRSAIFAGRGNQRGRARPSVLVGINHVTAPHWHFFEFGTVHISARPFFRPGVLASRKPAAVVIAAGLKDLIANATRKATP